MASISKDETEVRWKLSYANLESEVTQSHIHFSARGISGPVVVFSVQQSRERSHRNPAVSCRARDNQWHVYGRRRSRWCGGQGLEAGNLEELIAAIRAGATYANVHSTIRRAGEVRGQIAVDDDHGHDGHGR